MIALSVALLLTTAAGPKGMVNATPPPVLVMVRTPGNAAFEKSQQRLHEELTLLLDSFIVILTSVEVRDFARKALADQIAVVLPLAKNNDAVAVVWLAEPLPGQMMLHLVARGTGRTLVRTLEFDRKSQSENVLALMLRELLGTAFLYEPVRTVPEPVRNVVSAVRRTMPAMEELTPPPPATIIVRPPAPEVLVRTCRWCLRLAGGALLESGLSDAVGPTARYGASLNASVMLDRFDLGLAVDLLGFSSKVSTFHLTSTSLPLMATGGWRLIRTRLLAAGPVVGLGTELSWTSAVPTTATPTISLFTAGPMAMAGFELSVTLGEFSLWSRVDFFFRTRRPQLIEITDNDPQWKLSSSTLRVSLGLAWEGL